MSSVGINIPHAYIGRYSTHIKHCVIGTHHYGHCVKQSPMLDHIQYALCDLWISI
jgi:hypothetical protein